MNASEKALGDEKIGILGNRLFEQLGRFLQMFISFRVENKCIAENFGARA